MRRRHVTTRGSLAGASLLAIVLVAILVPGCGRERLAARPPNIVLVSIDTLRADHLGCYGYPLPTSPAIDRFRRDAVLFREAIAPAPSTLPSHATMFTSLVPQHHGASHTQLHALPAAAVTLAEVLSQAGYRTAAVVGGGQMSRRFGLAQGFDSYESLEVRSGPAGAVVKPSLAAAVRRALAGLDASSRRPFFLFIHTYEVHHPYAPDPGRLAAFDPQYRGSVPNPISVELLREINEGRRRLGPGDRQHIVRGYDAGIAGMDEGFALLVRSMRQRGLYGSSLIVFTSDHGEELGEHGSVGWHGHTLYDELLRVPLVIKLPGVRRRGATVEGQVRLLDVAPTILELAGVAAPRQFEGESLAVALAGGALSPRPAVLWRETKTDEKGLFQGIRAEGWKLLRGRLFGLQQDPDERRDLAATQPEVAARLASVLRAELARSRPLRPLAVAIDAETQDRLRALGYLR